MKTLIHYPHLSGQSWLQFWCPGCGHTHEVPFINAPPPAPSSPAVWCYDGNPAAPTITPSLRILTNDLKDSECHVVVTRGILNYCTDCKHALAGKSVPMEPFEPYG